MQELYLNIKASKSFRW